MSTIRRFLSALIIAAFLAGGAWARSSGNQLKIVDVSPSVVMAQNPSGSNITCIALDDGLVFVDAGLDTGAASGFRKQMEKRFDRPTRYLMLTHAHIDHIFAMGAFADVEVVAAASARPLFEHQLSIEWNEMAIEGYTNIFPTFVEAQKTAHPFLPTIWVESERDFGSPSKKVVFANTGGHTTGSSYVHVPSEKVLVTGDLVQVDKYPYFGDQSTDLRVWIDTLKSWYAINPSHVCPGHGRVADRTYLELEWTYFEDLLAALQVLKDEGVAMEDAVIHPSLPAGYWDDDSPEPRWFKYCIALSYNNL
jgi:glyoxylase-like metal-dependent hydrolase (beta-lactamase superfamily II)